MKAHADGKVTVALAASNNSTYRHPVYHLRIDSPRSVSASESYELVSSA